MNIIHIIIKIVVRIGLLTVAHIMWATGHRYKWAARWLAHFYTGRGKSVAIPARLVQEAFSGSFGYHLTRARSRPYEWVGFAVTSSTQYEGRGFAGRPDLFYMVGGFSGQIKFLEASDSFHVRFEDVYDWHPMPIVEWDEDAQEYEVVGYEYFTTPVPEKYMFLWKLGRLIFGDECFPREGHGNGLPAISNKFWNVLGGREFVSSFNGIIWHIPFVDEPLRPAPVSCRPVLVEDEIEFIPDEP